jgi:hypothetical protein
MRQLGGFILLCALGASPALAASERCDLATITSTSAAHKALGLRAVEIVRRAGKPGWRSDNRLTQLVSPAATFNLGAGDVGGPLGSGVSGAHALATKMEADSFRFLGYDNMDNPGEGGCSKYKVEVEFVNHGNKTTAIMDFTFRDGRLVTAAGWWRTFIEGALKENR